MGTPPKQAGGLFRSLAEKAHHGIIFLGRSLLILGLILLAGAPAAGLESLLRDGIEYLVPQELLDGYASILPGATVLLSFFLLSFVFLFVPFLWRRTSDPTFLRLTVYASIQVVSASLGLLILEPFGQVFALLLGGEGTVAWWIWQRKWRGAGVAPSPLTGILKPPIVPGQIWYAFIVGAKENKIRPVLVLNWDRERSGWVSVYFTSQPPKSEQIAERYLYAEEGKVRGIPKETWVHVSDVRVLGKRAFRSYTGLAPAWLYAEACERAGCPPHADARTIEEISAGDTPSRFEMTLLRILGLRDPAVPFGAPLVSDAKTAASFIARVFWPR